MEKVTAGASVERKGGNKKEKKKEAQTFVARL